MDDGASGRSVLKISHFTLGEGVKLWILWILVAQERPL